MYTCRRCAGRTLGQQVYLLTLSQAACGTTHPAHVKLGMIVLSNVGNGRFAHSTAENQGVLTYQISN
jgi:hypothetical protein